MTVQPRLFADFAAAPTRRERSAVREHWASLSPSLFELDETAAVSCAVCGGEHASDECEHGEALKLVEVAEVDDERTHDPAQVREMFKGLGWSVSEPSTTTEKEIRT